MKQLLVLPAPDANGECRIGESENSEKLKLRNCGQRAEAVPIFSLLVFLSNLRYFRAEKRDADQPIRTDTNSLAEAHFRIQFIYEMPEIVANSNANYSPSRSHSSAR